jgi:flagellum-specific peptidoglycan hydrolase FlgJ
MQDAFLVRAAAAAHAAGHLFPDYAACEAALESGWGRSHLATEANNLFGQKQAHPALSGTGSLTLPTREFLHGAWVAVQAVWVRFPDWASCFRERMELLRSLAGEYPNYRRALAAATGEDFVVEVSRTWSTDPARAAKVLDIYRRHCVVFAQEPPKREVAALRPAAAPMRVSAPNVHAPQPSSASSAWSI